MTLVTLNHVLKYDIKKPYHIKIEKGDFIVVEGSNGSGKTTLFRLILGWIKPDQGIVRSVAKHHSYLPEQVVLPFFMKGYMYLVLHAKMKGLQLDTQLLHLFDIPLFRYVHELSKGNQQKLAIVATLIGHADLIILDEPLSGLDKKSINQFILYLEKLKKDGQTIIVSSHHIDLFKSLGTKFIHL